MFINIKINPLLGKKMEINKKEIGRKSRASGKLFEVKSREFLENQGLVVGRWTNNLILEENGFKMVASKPMMRFNPFTKTMQIMNTNTGFPDYFAYQPGKETEIIGYESKKAKYLDKEEKAKCDWYLKHLIFSKIFILYPGEKRGTVAVWQYFPKDNIDFNSN
jgi:hypothetical protein